MNEKKIYITQPSLPPLSEYIPYLEKIWSSKILTNCGPFHQQLEEELKRYLDVPFVSLTNNGMSALMTAIQSLDLKGEVITTPYSFVATSHALIWNNLKPVFVDVDPISLNIDPQKIENAITSSTTAILAVHCYGHPCDVEAIEKIGKKYNLKIIYDAAHAFGVKVGGRSVLTYGDISILSFHATKVFNTFEGGAIVCNNELVKRTVDQLKNFGIFDEENINAVGLNGKISEVNCALGLLQVKYVDKYIEMREEVDAFYRKNFQEVSGLKCLSSDISTESNYAYFPLLIEDDFPATRDEIFEKLKTKNIISRKYFYPLISNLQCYSDFSSSLPSNLPVANKAAKNILCLPIYPDLEKVFQEEVVKTILSMKKSDK